MVKFRKKPVIVEAFIFAGGQMEPVFPDGWLQTEFTITDDGEYLIIHTLEGEMKANKGDWIIKGVAGEFYPCKPAIFEKTYEEIREPEE